VPSLKALHAKTGQLARFPFHDLREMHAKLSCRQLSPSVLSLLNAAKATWA
jgi:hypothetical protein